MTPKTDQKTSLTPAQKAVRTRKRLAAGRKAAETKRLKFGKGIHATSPAEQISIRVDKKPKTDAARRKRIIVNTNVQKGDRLSTREALTLVEQLLDAVMDVRRRAAVMESLSQAKQLVADVIDEDSRRAKKANIGRSPKPQR